MAVTSKVYTPANIIQGPADVYIDVQVPPSAVPPAQGTNTWCGSDGAGNYILDAKGEPNDNGSAGEHLGTIEGPVTLGLTPKFDEIRADQHGVAIDAAFNSLESEIDFEVKEFVLERLSRFFSSPLGRYTNVAAGVVNPAADFLQIGSPQSSAATIHPLLIISPDRTATGCYWVVQAYKAYLKSAVSSAFARGKPTTWKMKFGCLADWTRSLTDQVWQVVRTT
jgi:hypothetical protein